MQKRLLLILVVLCCVVNLRAGDRPIGSLSGTYLVGSSQTYKKLTDVAAVLNNSGFTVTGNVVFELGSDYDGATGETFPITFNQFNVSGGNWTVTIRPKSGVTLRTTSGNPGTQPLITLNGADRIIFDGRAGGAGGIAWLIRNTATSDANATILLQNDAKKNMLTYLQLEGQTASAGTVHFSTSGPDGNDDNTISYCAIRDRSDVSTPARPVIGILSKGSEASTGNIFDHNNIFNFYNSGAFACGIRLEQGTTDVSVTYNSFYQEQPLLNAVPGTTLHAIAAGEWSSNGLKIADNFIGGSAPQCGGTPWTLASIPGGNCNVTGISYGVFGTPIGDRNACNHNTIRNIAISFGTFTGITSIARMNITNNIIGNPDGHDDIKITLTGGGYPRIMMIGYNAPQPVSITGNRMGGITLAGSMNTFCDLNGIYTAIGGTVSNGLYEISDNVFGSTTIPDNIRVIGDTLPVRFTGIAATIPLGINCIGNTVAGVALGYAGTTGGIPFTGITVTPTNSSLLLLVRNNLVANISSPSLAAEPALRFETDILVGYKGIEVTASSVFLEVSGNTVRGLHLTGTAPIVAATGANTSITGMYLRGPSSAIYNNRIYDLSSANDLGGTATIVTGIRMEQFGGTITAYNNLVALDNGGLSNNCEINGFLIKAMSSTTYKLYHNTIYTGGSISNLSDIGISAPITYSAASSANAFFSIRNNLLVNGRTGGAGRHYLFRNTKPGNRWTVASSDTNVLVTGDLSKVGQWGMSDLDITHWKTTGGDVHSWFYTTSQVSPAVLFTDTATGDLSIKAVSRRYVAGKGLSGTGITTDFAGETRNANNPTIGAYEYIYVNVAPVIISHGGNSGVTLLVPENKTVVTTVTAFDDNALVYSLAGGEDEGKFSIDPSTGELSFITAPDFEHPGDANGDNAYIVTVQVTDGDSIAVQRFKVKITDANDHAPVITSYNGDAGVTLQAPENTTTVIATVAATDADKNTTITYSLVNEEDAAQFSVSSSTGELSFVTPPPDFEQPRDNNHDNIYVVTVKASDGDSSATQRFKIKILNANDHAPVITSYNGIAIVSVEMPENMQLAVTVTATDADSAAITYSIVNGKDGALFSVDASTGMLTFITMPDFEHPTDANSDNIYIVIVQASDGDSTATQRFEIKINNNNDSPLIITSTYHVAENTLDVTTLGAADADASVTVNIEPGEDAALFSLDPATGVLSFITAPDFENPADANGDNIYTVSVKMFDGSITTILRLNISVTDAGGAAARAANRNATEPEVQSTVVLQLEAGPEPGKAINVYPNPVTGKRFNLRMDSIAAGRYTLELYTTAGQLACRQVLNHTGKPVIYPVQLPANLTRGVYVMKLAGIDINHTEKLIID